MSGIRKYRRSKRTRGKQKKTATKMSFWDVLLVAGAAMVLLGGLVGAISYQIYSAGRPEEIANTEVGTFHVSQEAPGDPGRKAMAMAGFAAAGIGTLLTVLSLTARLIVRHLSRGAEKAR